jgi:hypothetical protein
MADEYVHKNPRDPVEERFLRMEERFNEITRNMSLLMEDPARNIKHSEKLEA